MPTTNERHGLPYLANCSMLFTELPLLRRAAAAAAAGFRAVEFWWPFPEPVPPPADVDRFVASIEDAGVALVALNLWGGDLAAGERGVLSVPGRSIEFRDNLPVALDIGRRLGVRGFNALYGCRADGLAATEQDDLAVVNLVSAAGPAAAIGATVLVEPLSAVPAYPLRSAADVSAVLGRLRAAGATNVGMLFDLFHLAANGEDLAAAIATHGPEIGHVQIADFPGRCEPGTGSIDFARHLLDLQRHGYDGWVSLEYRPRGETVAGLSWLPQPRRGTS